MILKNQSRLNGSWLVFLILFVGIVGAGLTVWNYSQHVFSTSQATIIDSEGRIQASFPPWITAQLHPYQQAKVTFKDSTSTAPLNDHKAIFRAQIMTIATGFVLLQLLEKPISVSPGEACEVTVDTTLPISSSL